VDGGTTSDSNGSGLVAHWGGAWGRGSARAWLPYVGPFSVLLVWVEVNVDQVNVQWVESPDPRGPDAREAGGRRASASRTATTYAYVERGLLPSHPSPQADGASSSGRHRAPAFGPAPEDGRVQGLATGPSITSNPGGRNPILGCRRRSGLVGLVREVASGCGTSIPRTVLFCIVEARERAALALRRSWES